MIDFYLRKGFGYFIYCEKSLNLRLSEAAKLETICFLLKRLLFEAFILTESEFDKLYARPLHEALSLRYLWFSIRLLVIETASAFLNCAPFSL